MKDQSGADILQALYLAIFVVIESIGTGCRQYLGSGTAVRMLCLSGLAGFRTRRNNARASVAASAPLRVGSGPSIGS